LLIVTIYRLQKKKEILKKNSRTMHTYTLKYHNFNLALESIKTLRIGRYTTDSKVVWEKPIKMIIKYF
jgi:hypothetical protein